VSKALSPPPFVNEFLSSEKVKLAGTEATEGALAPETGAMAPDCVPALPPPPPHATNANANPKPARYL
jgi:hypothetical protein